MMGNTELAPEVDVSTLEPLLAPNVVSELLDTYMYTLTVSRAACGPQRMSGTVAAWAETSRQEARGLVLVLAS